MEIRKKDISDILSGLPKANQFSTKQDCPDVVFATLGFEDRTHAVIDYLFQEKVVSRINLVLITYPTNEEDNKKNLFHFQKYKDNFKSFVEIKYQRFSFQGEVAEAVRLLCFPCAKVLLDVSTASSYLFYPLFHELLKADIDLKVAYTEAEHYYPSQEDWDCVAQAAKTEKTLFTSVFEQANFLSEGVDDVYSVNLFSEMNTGNRPSILVLIPSFSAIRINAIRARDQEINKTPTKNTYWLIGQPPSETNSWRVAAVMQTNSVDHFPPAQIKGSSTFQVGSSDLKLSFPAIM